MGVKAMSFKRLFYTLFLYLIFPFVLLRLLWRSRSNKAYRLRWSERLGIITKNKKNSSSILWLHAVSVGEVIAAKPLILALLAEFPEHTLLVTTTTPTGSDRVKDIFAEQIKNQLLIHTYFPYDLLGSVARFIGAFNPKILIVVETEIWPNLYAKCYQKAIPVVMVNARLSDKSLQSYLKIKTLVAETLSKVSDIAVRSDIDKQRFLQLGASTKQITQSGNIKYDLKIDKKQLENAAKYQQLINQKDHKKRLVLVAASTHAGEDAKIMLAYKTLLEQFPKLLLVLVPRHPERFVDVYDECVEQLPAELNVIKHSEYSIDHKPSKTDINVIVGDSMGEMQMWYSLADVVFIGGSLVKTGGHNPLEATIFGVPVYSGPHMFNFEDIAAELLSQKLLSVCADEFELSKEMSKYLENLEEQDVENTQHTKFKDKAEKFMQQHRGVTTRLVNLISKNLTH